MIIPILDFNSPVDVYGISWVIECFDFLNIRGNVVGFKPISTTEGGKIGCSIVNLPSLSVLVLFNKILLILTPGMGSLLLFLQLHQILIL